MGGDVIDMTNEKKKRAPRKAKANANDPTKDEIYEAVMARMNGLPAGIGWPEFPQRYHIVRDAKGRKAFLEEVRRGVVAHVVRNAIEDAVIDYSRSIAISQNAALLPRDGEIVTRLWSATTKPLATEPIGLAEASTPGLAFTRLAFDADVPLKNGRVDLDAVPAPDIFLKFLQRCSQPQAVAAFFGSLFYPEADRSQYLYLFGQGNDGKGTLLRFLYKLLGTAAESMQPPEGSQRRWFNSQIYGKRLIVFPDCDSPEFFASAMFKSATGGDPVFVEPKGEPGFSVIPTAKFIAASNAKPDISSQTADQRRLIFVEFESIPDNQIIPNFEAQLLAHAKQIVTYCKAQYLHEAPAHSVIRCDKASHVALETEEQWISLFYRHFELDPNAITAGERVMAVLQQEKITSGKVIKHIKAVWQRVFGITIQDSENPTRRKCRDYVGIRYAPKDYRPFASQTPEDGEGSGG